MGEPKPKLNVAVAGLGRMGSRHACHLHKFTPRAHLMAACSPEPRELAWAKEHLHGVRLYLDFDEMLREEIKNGLQAVVVASATAVHAEQTIKAIRFGLHVLCEKPLSTNVNISQSVATAYRKSQKAHPSQKVLCGFSRRFDSSYRDAYQKMCSGLIGIPSVFRSQTCDKLLPSSFFVPYAQVSGGIFVDCSIHDIDLALWFFRNGTKELPMVKSVSAVGITAIAPELRRWNDSDNAIGIVEFYNGKIAQFFCSRMMASGQEDYTEIIGTKGKLSINAYPAKNHVLISEPEGIRRELTRDYYGRYKEAFIRESNEFVECCLEDKPLPMEVESAVKAVRLACALQESLITGQKIEFDEAGQRITPFIDKMDREAMMENQLRARI